jgi:hypothetical protein
VPFKYVICRTVTEKQSESCPPPRTPHPRTAQTRSDTVDLILGEILKPSLAIPDQEYFIDCLFCHGVIFLLKE